jgi:hypothetical protein
MTFVAGLRDHAMVAPFVLKGAMNGLIFLAYVKQCLVPALKRGDIVLMDNVRVHKVAGVKEAIEAVGATLTYLPSYSPDLNPMMADQIGHRLGNALLTETADDSPPVGVGAILTDLPLSFDASDGDFQTDDAPDL